MERIDAKAGSRQTAIIDRQALLASILYTTAKALRETKALRGRGKWAAPALGANSDFKKDRRLATQQRLHNSF